MSSQARYLVVDLDAADGDVVLPSGKRGRTFASFHSRDLAMVLATVERNQGRCIVVLDSEHEWPDGRKSGVRFRET